MGVDSRKARQCIKQMPEMNAKLNSSPVQYASFIESMSKNPARSSAHSYAAGVPPRTIKISNLFLESS